MNTTFLPVEIKQEVNEFYHSYLLLKTDGRAELYNRYPSYDHHCSENDNVYFSHFKGKYEVLSHENENYTLEVKFTKNNTDKWRDEAVELDCNHVFKLQGKLDKLGLNEKDQLAGLEE